MLELLPTSKVGPVAVAGASLDRVVIAAERCALLLVSTTVLEEHLMVRTATDPTQTHTRNEEARFHLEIPLGTFKL